LQRRFFTADYSRPGRLFQGVVLSARSPLQPAVLTTALTAVAAHHDILRLVCPRGGAVIRPASGAAAAFRLDVADAADSRPDDAVLIRHLGAEAFDLATGPLLHATLFPGPPDRLLLTVHRLIADDPSWGLLVDDLNRAYAQAAAGQSVYLPPVRATWADWTAALAGRAATLAAPPDAAPVRPAAPPDAAPARPADPLAAATSAAGADPTVVAWQSLAALAERIADADAHTPLAELSGPAAAVAAWSDVGHESRRLDVAAPAARPWLAALRAASPGLDLLAAATALAVSRVLDRRQVAVEVVADARAEAPGLDFSRTIGPLAAACPLVVDLATATPEAALAAVAAARQGLPGGVLAYELARPRLDPRLADPPAVSVACHDVVRAVPADATPAAILMTPWDWPPGAGIDPANRLPQAVMVEAYAGHDSLRLDLLTDPATVAEPVADDLATALQTALSEFAAYLAG
jgi:hypothetical protein